MSSNIRVKKIFQHCKQSFIAQKTVTKFCSLKCAGRNYKKRKKEEKITRTILETNDQLLKQSLSKGIPTVMPEKEKPKGDWISIEDVAELIGVGVRTLYRFKRKSSIPKHCCPVKIE
ncbi:hypothetical protein [Agriterribacter sp.]|uniref:helix-turn-helix transcriptional regulator n=1 Tax=Agriterribacter sp. TaxID=2821509 RepID=UPI002CE76B78|nr:hypothetical protein [Agriterribacter sp.]HRO47862.1 hypothetical protein [Agriterribacter sp.]